MQGRTNTNVSSKLTPSIALVVIEVDALGLHRHLDSENSDDHDERIVSSNRPGLNQRQETGFSLLSYYKTAGTSRPASATPSHNTSSLLPGLAIESSSSSDDLSMGPNGYYHPTRTSSRSSSSLSDHEDLGKRHSSTTVRTKSEHEHDRTPRRSTYISEGGYAHHSDRDAQPASLGHSSPLARKPSRRAVENADNRRIAIVEVDSPSAPSSSAPDNVHQSTTTSQSLRSVPRAAATENTLAARRGAHEFSFVSTYRNAY